MSSSKIPESLFVKDLIMAHSSLDLFLKASIGIKISFVPFEIIVLMLSYLNKKNALIHLINILAK